MAMVVPFQTPVVIVPIDANDDNVVTAVLINVPVVGSVTFVAAVVVKVRAKLPDVVNEFAVLILPPNVIVFEPLLTPVPPFVPVSVPVTFVFAVPMLRLPNAGADAPADSSGCPDVPADVYAWAVPVPYPTPPAVGVAVLFVPPALIGSVPVVSADVLVA